MALRDGMVSVMIPQIATDGMVLGMVMTAYGCRVQQLCNLHGNCLRGFVSGRGLRQSSQSPLVS
jgi:hypothetical protein